MEQDNLGFRREEEQEQEQELGQEKQQEEEQVTVVEGEQLETKSEKRYAIVKKFAETSTIGGVRELFKQPGYFCNFVWLFLILICTIFFAFHFSTILIRNLEGLVGTEIQFDSQPAEPISFTMCFTPPYDIFKFRSLAPMTLFSDKSVEFTYATFFPAAGLIWQQVD
ncbi:hypothetical protein Ciccas_011551 [Cichlidogyrus casuarinus]|uniref:Uncharacterized protein n=1 Tax=Cichlidogyrus casuarinus TaxID=1844966 RepID=A0ABD2PQX0_9PLAT